MADPRSPLQVEYSRAAMERIRRRAREGLMAAPRVGMGVGGLLLGVRNGTRVRVLDSIEMPCSHSAGPSFELTPDEKRESREMIAEAISPDISQKVGVIGWYCSKTRDDVSLSPSDRSLFDELLPGPWQVALVVRPNVVDAMRAAFFFRDNNGTVAKGLECYVDEWRPATEEKFEAAPEAAEAVPDTMKTIRVTEEELAVRAVAATSPEPPAQPERQAPEQKAPEHKVKTAKPAARPVARKPPSAKPLPVTPKQPSSFRISEMLLPWLSEANGRLVLKIALPVLIVLLVALATRQFWMPKPPLALNVTELDGTLLIRWNPEALHGIDHASMFVNDGGRQTPVLIPLDRFQLSSGLLSYRPQSKRITAKLDAGEMSAIGSWFAPPPPAPVAPRPETTADDASAPAGLPLPSSSPQSPPLSPPAEGKTTQ